ncbi:MAG TPA: FUSC family protein, partial [Telluria sp.]|nr:FUSC family protein [Telluria sp.]
LVGSVATVFMVPRLANAPELLSLALACWVGFCLYVSLLDRTPRSYVFMLAGYTAGLIGFPVVTDPGTVFDVALARVEEIGIGILCASIVHSLVLPHSLGSALLARLDHAVGDAQRWIRDAVSGGATERGTRARRTLAGDITELRLMSTHLPFDTSHLRWTSGMIHALHDRLTQMVPLLLAVEDRLAALHEADPAGLTPRWRAVLDSVAQWVERGNGADPARAAQLRAAITAAAPRLRADSSWSDILQVNLAVRLRALVDAIEHGLELRGQIGAVLAGGAPAPHNRLPGASTWVLHRDHGMALRSAFAAVAAILGCCAFWILTGWPSGAAAPMMAGVFCCFFATQDDPVPAIKLFLHYTVVSIPLSALYLLVVMPAVHSFEMLALVTAPPFLLLAIFIARPATAGQAMALVFGVLGMLMLQDTATSDIVSFTNGMLAQLAGIGAAALATGLLRSVSAGWTARRLQRAGRGELVKMGDATRAPALGTVSARMLDRIALLTPRLAMAGPGQDLGAVDALADLRVGLNMAQLRNMQGGLERDGVTLHPLMRRLADHFRRAPDLPAKAEPALLDAIDALLRAVCARVSGRKRVHAAAALASLRRDLFPAAPSYTALMRQPEECS